MSSSPRFAMQATDLTAVATYFTRRATQGLHDGWSWSGRVWPLTHQGEIWGARTRSTDAAGVPHQSIYVFEDHTGRGHFGRALERFDEPIVTAPDCHIEDFLKSQGIPYAVAGRFTTTPEYRAIAAHFDHRVARRSGVHFMNHIDEGLAVLAKLGAPGAAWRAFCLHPFVQADEELLANRARVPDLTPDPWVLTLTMEYRSVANAYLGRDCAGPEDLIELGPLDEVHAMLRADKVQNFKDFLLHHRDTHPRRDALNVYFENWLARLGITRPDFDRMADWLDVRAHLELRDPVETS